MRNIYSLLNNRFRKDGTVLFLTEDDREIRIDMELASTPEEQSIGLMFRSELPPMAGMLFDFQRTRQGAGIWMRNSLIHLDIIWIDPERVIRQIHANAETLSDRSWRYNGMSRYILEVNAGFTEAFRIHPGDRIQIKADERVEAGQGG